MIIVDRNDIVAVIHKGICKSLNVEALRVMEVNYVEELSSQYSWE
jgi:hypothetical protein